MYINVGAARGELDSSSDEDELDPKLDQSLNQATHPKAKDSNSQSQEKDKDTDTDNTHAHTHGHGHGQHRNQSFFTETNWVVDSLVALHR